MDIYNLSYFLYVYIGKYNKDSIVGMSPYRQSGRFPIQISRNIYLRILVLEYSPFVQVPCMNDIGGKDKDKDGTSWKSN